jgi:hypothetical protein
MKEFYIKEIDSEDENRIAIPNILKIISKFIPNEMIESTLLFIVTKGAVDKSLMI